jgi:hypothetical protein
METTNLSNPELLRQSTLDKYMIINDESYNLSHLLIEQDDEDST